MARLEGERESACSVGLSTLLNESGLFHDNMPGLTSVQTPDFFRAIYDVLVRSFVDAFFHPRESRCLQMDTHGWHGSHRKNTPEAK
jgi:hypothetical protein